MDFTAEKAYAKLNLSLDVLSKRDDGYHEMCMIMQSVAFCDDLSLSLRRDGMVNVSINFHYIPCDDRNIAVKAARAFFQRLGDPRLGADITIKKRVPVCAGMGGGSSDGAAVLRALNRMTGKPFSVGELESLGASLGSDVPFCVAGGTCLATGRGEKLTEAPPLPHCTIVICKPRFSVSTPELFTRLDSFAAKLHPDTAGLLSCLENSDLRGLSQRMYNVFENVLPQGKEDLSKIKGVFIDNGAHGAVMTGTGSAVFGLFDDEKKALTAHNELKRTYREVFITTPIKRLVF